METKLAVSAHETLVRQPPSADAQAAGAVARNDLSLAYVGSDLCCAWCGPALLVLNRHAGAIAAVENPMTGFFFREARHLSTLRFEINGSAPWLCEIAQDDARHITLTSIHPEFAQFGGGGSGQARD
ncbi:MAG: glycogen debranching N-terminal domain-containing protein, partial [Gemmatimonadaceae bacterium]